MAILDTSL